MSLKINAIKSLESKEDVHPCHNMIPSGNRRTIFAGSTGSGKSTLIATLLTDKRFLKNWFHIIYIFSPNVHVDKEYKYIKEKNRGKVLLFEDFDIKEVEGLYDRMTEDFKLSKKRKLVRGKLITPKPNRYLWLFDDFADNDKAMKSAILRKIFFQSRKYQATTWVTTQKYKRVPNDLRTNAEHIIVYSQDHDQSDAIGEEQSHGKFSKKVLSSFINSLPDYKFIHINKKSKDRFNYCFESVIE
jgi:hypothetical protein